MKNLINDYIKQIKLEDIKRFGEKNGIFLSETELFNLLNLLKDKNILNYNDEEYEYLLKKNIEPKNFIKSLNLLKLYKNKYKNYL